MARKPNSLQAMETQFGESLNPQDARLTCHIEAKINLALWCLTTPFRQSNNRPAAQSLRPILTPMFKAESAARSQ